MAKAEITKAAVKCLERWLLSHSAVKNSAASINGEASESLWTRTELSTLDGQNTTSAAASRRVVACSVQLRMMSSAKTRKPKNNSSESHCSPSSSGTQPPGSTVLDHSAPSA